MKFRSFAIIALVVANLFLGNTGYAAELPAPYPFPWDFPQSGEGAKIEVSSAVESLGNITGLLVPHHMVVKDKVFEAYRIFAQENAANPPDTIFVIGPNHFEVGVGNILMNSTGFQTRFGELAVSAEAEKFLGTPVYDFAFYKEHSISAHVNFIKDFFPNAKIVPIILKWNTKTAEINRLAEKIARFSRNASRLGKKTAMIASIDFSHYQTSEVADFHDVLAENAILRCDTEMVRKLEIDSHATLSLFFKTLKKVGACSSEIFSHTNSQSYTKEKLSATTSHFMAFFGKRARTFAKPPRKIPGLITVIHKLSKEIAGEEDRFFMGNDRIWLNENGKYFEVNLGTKQRSALLKTPLFKSELKRGEELCGGRDFGIVEGTKEVKCF
jgi:poly-gamma-glutamate synthesis protein (capsule biosynthesis protein)